MDKKKVLVVCQGYYKSTVIRNMIPWEELGYHLILGLNSYYSISAIRKIDPDALIVVDYMPGQTIGAVLELYRHTTLPMKIILVPYEQNIVDEEDRKAFQVISWDELTPENLQQALEAIFDDPELSTHRIFPDVSDPDPFADALEKYSRILPMFPVLPMRVLFQKPLEGKAKEQAEKTLRRAGEDIGTGKVLVENERCYALLVDVPTNILSEGFWRLNVILEELQNRLSHATDAQVVVFLGEIVGNRSIVDEYEKLVSLAPYAFFHSHHGIQSATFIQRHTLNYDVPLQEVTAQYLPLLKALIRNDEGTTREILEEIYLKHLKLHQNMAFYRLVQSQLNAIYGCACSIHEDMETRFEPVKDYWSIEEALDDQIRRFTRHMTESENTRSFGKLTADALEIVLQQHTKALYASEIADRLNVSEAHLSRTFKKEVGIGPTECIRCVRIYTAAADLLEERSSIREVAQKHGFEDPKYFNKVFRKVMGMTPTEWIREQKGGI